MASLIPSAWRKIHRSTLSAAAVGAVIALVALGPIVVAAVILRCCDDESGPARDDWIKLLLLLGLAVFSGVAAPHGHLRRLAHVG
jgi:hypothetical protein